MGPGGIDSQVGSRVNQFRGNPGALQQRYGQGRDLLDLLALQKIKREKEAAKQQMQMQMQSQPETIYEQREQDVKNLTKEELARQIGQTNNHSMQQMQKGMQDVAARAGNMNASRAGIAAAAPQNRRMASGGIVKFQEGGSVEEKIRAALQQGANPQDVLRLSKGNYDLARRLIAEYANKAGSVVAGMPDASTQGIASSQEGPTLAQRVKSAWDESIPGKIGNKFSEYSQEAASNVSSAYDRGGIPAAAGAGINALVGGIPAAGIAAYEGVKPVAEAGGEFLANVVGMGDAYDRPSVAGAPPPSPTQQADPMAGLSEVTPQGSPVQKQQFPSMANMQANDILLENMQMSPDAERNKGIAGVTDVMAPVQQLANKRIATTDEYNTTRQTQADPKKQARERLGAFLRGAGGTPGGVGQVLGRAGASGSNMRQYQENRALSNLRDLAGLQDTDTARQSGISTAIANAGENRYNQAQEQRSNSAAQVIANQIAEDRNLTAQQRNVILDASNQMRVNEIMLRQAMDGQLSLQELVNDSLADTGYFGFAQQLATMERGSKEYEELKTTADALRAAAQASVQQQMAEYRTMQGEAMGNIRAAQSRPGYSPDAFSSAM